MTTRRLLDPELRDHIDLFPKFDLYDGALEELRALARMRSALGDPDDFGVEREELYVPGDGHNPRCLLYKPKPMGEDRPAYLHIHGGGYIAGIPETSDAINMAFCSDLGLVVLSVDYRLAPEHPIPAPLDDCYAALRWLHENASALGINPDRIATGGESAGGGLAAALAIRARDEGEYSICHQHLTFPMLDNLTGSESNPADPLTGEFVWTRRNNQFGWESYLGDADAVAPQVPARVENYEGLPSTWMFTAALDLFRDENIAYAQELMKAGVRVELVSYAGACHGFQMAMESRMTKRFYTEHKQALARLMGISY